MVIYRDAKRHASKQGVVGIRKSGRETEEGDREQPLAAEEMSRLGFSEVVNQEHRHVSAFKGEVERN